MDLRGKNGGCDADAAMFLAGQKPTFRSLSSWTHCVLSAHLVGIFWCVEVACLAMGEADMTSNVAFTQ